MVGSNDRSENPPSALNNEPVPAQTHVNIRGRWQGPEVDTELSYYLLSMGHSVVNPLLRGWDTEATLVDHARTVIEAVEGKDNLVINAHSLGTVVAAMMLSEIELERINAVNLIAPPGPKGIASGGKRYVEGFEDGVEDLGDGTNTYDPALQPKVHYSGLTDEERLESIIAANVPWAIEDKYKGPIPSFPSPTEVAIYSMRGSDDVWIHTAQHLAYVDRNWVGMDAQSIEGAGHAPHVVFPEMMARAFVAHGHAGYVHRHFGSSRG